MKLKANVSIAEIKKRIQEKKEQAEKSSGKFTASDDFYPFWLMNDDDVALVRFIPDINEDNPFPFYLETFSHKLDINGKEFKFPCPKTFEAYADCPVCARSQGYYNSGDDKNGGYYYKNRLYHTRIMVLKDPLGLVDKDDKPIDYIGKTTSTTLTKKLVGLIEKRMSRWDNDRMVPWDFAAGTNFRIEKQAQGDYSDYMLSDFEHDPSPIPEEYVDNIELIDYRELLPKNPGLDKVQHYLDAHDGVVSLYDDDKKSSKDETASESKPEVEAKAEAKPETEAKAEKPADAPKEVVLSSDSKDTGNSDNDLIRQILARHKEKETSE